MKIISFSILVIAIAISFSALPAKASFWLKGMGFHYSPDYGNILEAGSGRAFAVGYDFGNWGLMLDTFSFKGKADYYYIRLPGKFFFHTSTSPTFLSIVYRPPIEDQPLPLYLGIGIGSFPSELKVTSNIYEEIREKDYPMGFQIFAGMEQKLTNRFFFSIEVKYLSAKAKYSGNRYLEPCSTDWTGFLANIGIGYRLGI